MGSQGFSPHTTAAKRRRRSTSANGTYVASGNRQGLLAIAALSLGWLSTPLMARTTDTAVSGALSPAENGCLLVSAFYYGVDCSYTGEMAGTAAKPLPWVGPTLGPVYVAPNDPRGVPSYTPGDNEPAFAPPLTGTLTIDDRGTPGGDDDVLSGTLTVGAAMRSHVSRINDKSPPQRVVESWNRIVHTLAPTIVNGAAANNDGGYDYVIAAKGLPRRLCRKAKVQDCFPSAAAPLMTDGKWGAGTWAGPGAVPLGRSPAFGANGGARTTAVIEEYRCSDTAQGTLCGRGIDLWGGPEDPGWDNLLLTVSIDRTGRVLRAEGYWMEEYRVDAGPLSLRGPTGKDNSWLSGYLVLTGTPPAAGSAAPPP